MGDLITIFIGAGIIIGIIYYLYKRNFQKKQKESSGATDEEPSET